MRIEACSPLGTVFFPLRSGNTLAQAGELGEPSLLREQAGHWKSKGTSKGYTKGVHYEPQELADRALGDPWCAMRS